MTTDVDAFLANSELMHHGVKGMKWGVTRDRDSGGGSGKVSRKEARKARNEEIGRARVNQAVRQRKVDDNLFKLIEADLKGDKAGVAKFQKLLDSSVDEALNHPDAATATKLTTGEKWVNGVSWGLAGAGLAITLGSMAASSGRRR